VVCVCAATRYKALSYTWGDASVTEPLVVNEIVLEVTNILRQASRVWRLPTKKRTIWADALCTNQSDLGDRAAQIREVGQIFPTQNGS